MTKQIFLRALALMTLVSVAPSVDGLERVSVGTSHESLAKAVAKAGYTVRRHGNQLLAANGRQRIRGTFSPEGLRLTVYSMAPNSLGLKYNFAWRLKSVGYGADQVVVEPGSLKSRGERVENVRTAPAITEWYVNQPKGLEHGFTLPERLKGFSSGNSLRLVLATSGELTPITDAVGQQILMQDDRGKTVLAYDKLKVWDAKSLPVSARMAVIGKEVVLDVDDANAVYPLTIDPTFNQEFQLTAHNAASSSQFGFDVALSGDTAVVGAPVTPSPTNQTVFVGGAYVFVRENGNWVEQAYLTLPEAASLELVGTAVDIDGDTIVVTSSREDSGASGINGDQTDNSAIDSGAAYVFGRTGTNWTMQAYLKPSNTGAGDQFGISAAISGETIVVGAHFEDSSAFGIDGNGADNSAADSGAAYVFVRSSGVWSQEAYLKASNTDANDWFGTNVEIDGDSIIVGATVESAGSVGINGDGADNSVGGAGAAYVFVRNGSVWTQQAYLKAHNASYRNPSGAFSNGQFGRGVSIHGDLAVVGAYRENSAGQGVNPNGFTSGLSGENSGAAYIFGRTGSNWIEQAYIKAFDNAADLRFGNSVAVHGNRVVVGTGNGDKVYLYAKTNGAWLAESTVASSISGVAGFGFSVDLSATRVLVGSPFDNVNATTNAGSAHVFTINEFEPPLAVVSTLAGAGASSSDGVTSFDTGFLGVRGLAVDTNDNLYISDHVGNRVRVLNLNNHVIGTAAGTGTAGFLGDGTSAALSHINAPRGVSVDRQRNRLIIADHGNERVRMVTLTNGLIGTIAGNGVSATTGDGGLAIVASLHQPYGTAVHPDGSVYISVLGSHTVRRIDTNGFISTIAGIGSPGYSGDGGAATVAQLNTPTGLAFDTQTNLYIADAANHRIRRVSAVSGNIETIVGSGVAGYGGDGGPAISAKIRNPAFLAFDASENLYFTDAGNHAIRFLRATDTNVYTLAGTGSAGSDGDGGDSRIARFNSPSGIALDSRGNLYVSDENNRRIRKIELVSPTVFDRQPRAPMQSIPLFTNNLTFQFARQSNGASVPWRLADTNVLEVVPGTGSIVTTQKFTSFRLHAEFRTPTNGQNGNSGIFLQGRYEVQIFNSFGKSVLDANDCGAIWGQTPPPTNACLAPGEWQTYEIEFHAAQWNGTNKVRNARATVALNGVILHRDVEIPGTTQAGNSETNTPGPVLLQDNGSAVQFRNVIVTPFDIVPNVEWARVAGDTTDLTNSFDVVESSAVDAVGNVFMAGHFRGTARFGSTNVTSSGGEDAFLAKYAPNGDLLWVVTGGGPGPETAFGVAVDAGGNAVIAGRHGASGMFSGLPITHAGSNDVFVAKYNPSGALIWLKAYGGTENDWATDVSIDRGGAIYVSGNFMSPSIQIGTNTFNAAGLRDLFALKLLPNGDPAWSVAVGGVGDNEANAIVADETGGAWLAGESFGDAQFGPVAAFNGFSRDAFVMRVDSVGIIRRVNFTAGTGDERITSIDRDRDGALYLGGWFVGGDAVFGVHQLTQQGGSDAFVVKTDPNGETIWARQLIRDVPAPIESVQVDAAGDVFVTGNYLTNALIGVVALSSVGGSENGYLAKYASDGDLRWVLPVSGGGRDVAASLALGPGGATYLSGSFGGGLDFRGAFLASIGREDLFMSRLQSSQSPIAVAQWRFDDGGQSPLVVEDSGVFGGMLSATGAVYTAGFSTNALSLNLAENGHVSLGAMPLSGFEPITISLVFRTLEDDARNMVILSRHETNTGSGFIFGINGLGTNPAVGQVFFTETGAFGDALISPKTNYNDGNWHSVVMTYEPFGAKSLYVDGELAGSAPTKLIAPTSVPLVAGGLTGMGVPFGALEGGIDEIQIYTRALIPADVGLQAVFPEETLKDVPLAPFEWVRSVGVSPGGQIEAEAVATDPAGDIYITGWYEGDADFGNGVTLTNRGREDMFLAKYDRAGALLWVRHGGGRFDDRGNDLAIDPGGNVVVCGNYVFQATFESFTLSDSGGGSGGGGGGGGGFNGGFVAKYNPAGDLILIKDGWGDSDAVDTDRNGNIYLAGRSRLRNIANNIILPNVGSDDAWVARFNSVGAVSWAKSFGSVNNDGITDLKIDDNNNLIVVGDFRGTMNVGGVGLASGGNNNNNTSPFLIRLDAATGNPVMVRQGAGFNSAIANSLVIHPDGSFRTVGQYQNGVSFGGLALTNSFFGGGGGGFQNVAGFEVLHNTAGTPVFTDVFQDNLAAVTAPDNENIYLYGSFNGTETNAGLAMTAAGSDDAFLVKRTRSGQLKYVRRISSVGDDLPAVGDGVSVDSLGNVYVAGHTILTNGGTVFFDDLAINPPSDRSAFLAKISSEIGIRREPADQVATNLNVVFRTLPAGEHPFGYQWFFNGTTPIVGATNAFLPLLTLDALQPGSYHVVVSNAAGSVLSRQAELTLALPPIITSEPASHAAALNRDTTLAVGVGGVGPFTYQWYKDGALISDATNAVLTLTTLQNNDAGAYHAVINNVNGSATSQVAILTTFPEGVLPLVVTPPSDTNAFVGDFISFDVVAGGEPTLVYQWRKNQVPISSARNRSLFLLNLQTVDSGDYDVVINNTFGSVTSAPARLNVIVPTSPTITNQPVSQTVLIGNNVTFEVGATGSPAPLVQWLHNNTAIPGAMGQTLSLTNVGLADAGTYSAQVFNGAPPMPSVTSAGAVLTVHQVPGIVTQPLSVVATNLSQPAQFVSTVSGFPPPVLQWFKDSVALTNGNGYFGVNSTNLQVPAASLDRLGTYHLSAVNASGTVNSGPALLGLNFPPALLLEPVGGVVGAGGAHLFSMIATGRPPLGIQWTKNGAPVPGADAALLSLTNLNRFQSGGYRVTVTNSQGSVTSGEAVLRVLVPQRLGAPVYSNAVFRFVFTDQDGSNLLSSDVSLFQVQFSTNAGAWHDLPGGLVFTNGQILLEDSPAIGVNRRFYRVLEP